MANANEKTEQEITVPKKHRRFDMSLSMLELMADRITAPHIAEERAEDLRKVIRCVKDPDLIIKGTKLPKTDVEEDVAAPSSKEDLQSPERVQTPPLGSHTQLKNADYIVGMAKPRVVDWTSSGSISSLQRISNDSDRSFLDKASRSEEDVKKRAESASPDVSLEPTSRISQTKDEKPKTKKPEKKKWKPKLKSTPPKPDPMILEHIEAAKSYAKKVGIFSFIEDWFFELYGMNPWPEEPIMLLRNFLENSIGQNLQDSGLPQMEQKLQVLLRRKKVMKIEIIKLLYLAHMVAPEIYDEKGNMIIPEPSVHEEDMTEEVVEVVHERLHPKRTTKQQKNRRVSKIKPKKKGKKRSESEVISRKFSKLSAKSSSRTERKGRKKTLTIKK